MPYLGLRGRPLLWAISATAGMGFILFGIDNASLGGVIASAPFTKKFNLGATAQGLVTGYFEVGALVGALKVSFFGDRFPRKRAIHFFVIPLWLGGSLQVAATGTPMLSVGRAIAGFGLGGIASIIPNWQNETSPAHLRGTLIGSSLSLLIFGLVIAYWAAYGLLQHYTTDFTWRMMFAIQLIAVTLMAVMLVFMPESPRWLLANGRAAEARTVLACLYDVGENDTAVDEMVKEIEDAIELEAASAKGWLDLFRRQEDGQRDKRRLLTACMIQIMQALSGSVAISYFVSEIFQTAIGLDDHIATLLSGFLQIWFLACSIVTWWLIERVGRRTLFLVTAGLMAIVMFVQAGMIKADTKATGYVAATMVFLYQGIFAIGWLAGVWVYSSEIISLSWRSKGLGLAVAAEWIFDFAVLMITPLAIDKIGYGIFILFGALNLCFIPLLYLYCPETAGIPLEAIDSVYRPGVDPVKEAARLRKVVKEMEENHKNVDTAHLGHLERTLSSDGPNEDKDAVTHVEVSQSFQLDIEPCEQVKKVGSAGFNSYLSICRPV